MMLEMIKIKRCPICGCEKIKSERWDKVGPSKNEFRKFKCGLEIMWLANGTGFLLDGPCSKENDFICDLVLNQADTDSGSHLVKNIDLYVLGQHLLSVHLFLKEVVWCQDHQRHALSSRWLEVEHFYRKLGGEVEINR